MDIKSTAQNPNEQIVQLANKELKQKEKSQHNKKTKKKDQSPKNVLFVILLIIVLVSAFIVRAQRTRYERENPGKPYIEVNTVFPIIQLNEIIASWKNKLDELLPDTLPKF